MLETCSYFNTGYPDPIGSHITSPDKQHKHSDPSGVAYLFRRVMAGTRFIFDFNASMELFDNAGLDQFCTSRLALESSKGLSISCKAKKLHPSQKHFHKIFINSSHAICKRKIFRVSSNAFPIFVLEKGVLPEFSKVLFFR